MLLRGFPFGASKGLRHPDEIVALGLCDEPSQGEQLAALFLGEARQVRAIRFDRSQYSHAGTQVVIGNVHAGIVLLAAHSLLPAACCKRRARAGCAAMSIKTFCASLALLLAACGGGSGDTQPGGAAPNPQPASADISLLFMGNSHTSPTTSRRWWRTWCARVSRARQSLR